MGWLTLVWVTLWEAVSWANVIGGVVVASAILQVLPQSAPATRVGFRPFATLKLLGYFSWKLVVASAYLAWEVVTPRNRINAAVISVNLRTRIPGVATAVASMVSLTPGTLTLGVNDDTMTLYIHVLHLHSMEETRASVLHLERLTLDAFPPRASAVASQPEERT